MVRLVILTADTHGGAARLRDDLDLETVILDKGGEAKQKVESSGGWGRSTRSLSVTARTTSSC